MIYALMLIVLLLGSYGWTYFFDKNIPDECPLTLEEILLVISKHGQVLEVLLNKKLPLTQQICIVNRIVY